MGLLDVAISVENVGKCYKVYRDPATGLSRHLRVKERNTLENSGL